MIGQNDRRSSEFHFSDALRQYGLWEQVPANDASVYRSAINSGRHYVYTADFLNTGLNVGENTVTLQISNSGGKNGILYDCIKMEAGELVTGIDNISIDDQAIPQPAKYLHQGRLVIERGGQLYTVNGKRLMK